MDSNIYQLADAQHQLVDAQQKLKLADLSSSELREYLDENKSLILKIVESQNSGKMTECAENQAKLQRNLMYVAAIADLQPQAPAVHSQYPLGGVMQSGSHYMNQHQQEESI